MSTATNQDLLTKTQSCEYYESFLLADVNNLSRNQNMNQILHHHQSNSTMTDMATASNLTVVTSNNELTQNSDILDSTSQSVSPKEDPGYSSGEQNDKNDSKMTESSPDSTLTEVDTNFEDFSTIEIKKHQFQMIHKTFNSTVYRSTNQQGSSSTSKSSSNQNNNSNSSRPGFILKRIKNTKAGQYELLQTKYSNKICPEYTLPILRNKSSSNHIYILQPEYGLSLYDFMVQRGAALIESELRFIYGHVALALFRLHEKAHLAHLDIKEENILINPLNLHPVLIDFATCRPLKKTAAAPQHLPKQLGSMGFAAPELCRGDPINDLSKCDVYSYGIALFSSLTGTYPTTDERTGQLNQGRPNIMSIELWEVISSCIYAKSPMERPSLEELLDFDFFRM